MSKLNTFTLDEIVNERYRNEGFRKYDVKLTISLEFSLRVATLLPISTNVPSTINNQMAPRRYGYAAFFSDPFITLTIFKPIVTNMVLVVFDGTKSFASLNYEHHYPKIGESDKQF